MKINIYLDPEEYPLQKSMVKSHAANLFKKHLDKNGIQWSKLKGIDI